MPEFRDDVLQVIPENEIDNVYQVMRREWPFSGYTCGFLKTCYDWRKKDPSFDVSLLYDKDNTESGIFVGILRSGHRTFGLVLFALEGYESELKNVLLTTKKVNWNELPVLQGVMPRHFDLVGDVVNRKGFGTSTYVESSLHFLHPNLTIDYDTGYPDDVYVARLTMDDVDLIYDLWPLTDIHTKEDIINSIESGPSFGVFSKFDNEPLAWVMQAHYGAIGMLYTKESVRRHGYAKILVMMMARKMVEEGIPPYASIVETNTKSITLFHSIGFKQMTRMRYLRVVPK